MTVEEEKLAEKALLILLEKEPVKCLQWMLVQLGREMLAANAATMEIKQESDLRENERYTIVCKTKITKVKKQKSLPIKYHEQKQP